MRSVSGILFIISAPSGSGKTTLTNELLKLVPGLEFSISYTTRPPRGSEANNLLSGTVLDSVVVTATIPAFRLDPELSRNKLVVLSATPLFAEAIRRIHTGGSLVELLET